MCKELLAFPCAKSWHHQRGATAASRPLGFWRRANSESLQCPLRAFIDLLSAPWRQRLLDPMAGADGGSWGRCRHLTSATQQPVNWHVNERAHQPAAAGENAAGPGMRGHCRRAPISPAACWRSHQLNPLSAWPSCAPRWPPPRSRARLRQPGRLQWQRSATANWSAWPGH
jgi:hypothetical protein